MSVFTVKCKGLTEVGNASNCFTVGKEYQAVQEHGLLFNITDDNGYKQLGIYPSCAFGTWEVADDSPQSQIMQQLANLAETQSISE